MFRAALSRVAPLVDRLVVAARLREIGRLLRMRGREPFRARAYERAATGIESLSDERFVALVAAAELDTLPGFGVALARLTSEIAETGSARLLEELRVELPSAVVALAEVPGISLARARALHRALGIQSIDDLERACEKHEVRAVKGFGPATEARLARALERFRVRATSVLLVDALAKSEAIVRYFAPMRALVAGDVRRSVEVTDELRTVVVDGTRGAIERFAAYPFVARVEARSETAIVTRLTSGERAIVKSVPEGDLGRALLIETGSAHFVSAIERRARARDVDLDEGWADESAIFDALGLEWTPPELRDDDGALAERGAPFALVRDQDVRGLVHCHTTYSDGKDDIEAMALAAEALGMEYLTITDHSPTAHYAGGVERDRLKRQWEEIARVQAKVRVKLLRGTESDILADGALDYPDDVLDELDVIIASVHGRMSMGPDEMTRRLVAAMKLPVFKIWGHPLGRLLLRREPFACDVEAIFDAAAEGRAAIEINGDPHRLDLAPYWIGLARERGLPFVVSTDAHSVNGLHNFRFGVRMARRGGLTKADVLNTLPAEGFAAAVSPRYADAACRWPSRPSRSAFPSRS